MDAEKIISFIKELYSQTKGTIPLHAPVFRGREKELLADCIDSTFVSTIGRHVDGLEEKICALTGAKHAIATVNGTAALHVALLVAGVAPGDEVVTQALSFVATANAISYCGADPVFLDIEERTLGLSPDALANFLEEHTVLRDGNCVNRQTGKTIRACIPMHTFGHPCRIDAIVGICEKYGITLIEDAAEAFGSFYKGNHCGISGQSGIFSFNGNKIVTSGGGGMVVTQHKRIADRIRCLTTTAKKSHPWCYDHTELGYNYRMPNINAALGLAQLEQFDTFLHEKRSIATSYRAFFRELSWQFIEEPENSRSNFWLNGVLAQNIEERDKLLAALHGAHIQARPAWSLLSGQPMYNKCIKDGLESSAKYADRIVSLPSGVR